MTFLICCVAEGAFSIILLVEVVEHVFSFVSLVQGIEDALLSALPVRTVEGAMFSFVWPVGVTDYPFSLLVLVDAFLAAGAASTFESVSAKVRFKRGILW